MPNPGQATLQSDLGALSLAQTPVRHVLISRWPLFVGLMILAAPTLFNLASQTWSTDAGAHGPLVLAAGVWLVWRSIPVVRRAATPHTGKPALALLLGPLLVYIFGAAYDFLFLEVAGLYTVLLLVAYWHIGIGGLRALWFPILYLSFLVPAPGWLVDHATGSLKTFVSFAATQTLHWGGVPSVRQGVVIHVAQYQLLVEDACSGINSLAGLMATGLLYVYLLHQATWRYAAVLAALIVPIAILVNIVRVVILVLLTVHYGTPVAQGFLHVATGMTLFAAALLLIAGVDAVLQPFAKRRAT